MDHKLRLKSLQKQLSTNKFDAIFVTHLPNIRYLCGFTGSSAVLIISEHNCVFFTDGRYTEQARAEVKGTKIVVGRKSALALASEWLGVNAKKWKVGIEAQYLTVTAKKQIKEKLSSKAKLRPVPALIEQARMVKDKDEIQLIRSAINMGAKLFEDVLKIIRPGIHESEVAAEMEYGARKSGAQEMSFPTII